MGVIRNGTAVGIIPKQREPGTKVACRRARPAHLQDEFWQICQAAPGQFLAQAFPEADALASISGAGWYWMRAPSTRPHRDRRTCVEGLGQFKAAHTRWRRECETQRN